MTEFKEECQTQRVHLELAALIHQEVNKKFKVTWRTLRTIAHSIMVHARVLEAYIHFESMSTADHIFSGSTNQRSDKQRRRGDHAI